MDALKVENLSFGYTEDKLVLDSLSLSIHPGEYTVLVGQNGSGKSTLAKLFIGLLQANSGDIYVFDQLMTPANVEFVRQDIGIVFQNPDNQFIGSTVEDDIAFGLENRCVKSEDMDAIIHEYAGKVGMLDYLKHEPNRLSGGQKQRVAIAGVLAMHPRIIIFDEATSMLDPKGKKEINDFINELKQKKETTIISITHDVEEISIADRVIVLKDGHVFYDGNPDGILNDEKKLKEAKLQIPFMMKVKDALAKKGINVNANNIEGMVEELCQYRSRM